MAELKHDQASEPAPAIAAEPALLADAPPVAELPVVEAEPLYTRQTLERLVRERLAELHGERVFTQEDVTRIVRDRLAKLEKRHAREMAKLRAELEQAFEAKRAELVREVAFETRDLLAQEWKGPWQTT